MALILLSSTYGQSFPQTDLLFEKILTPDAIQVGYSIVQFTDGGFGVSGERMIGAQSKMWTARLSERGDLLWEKVEGVHAKNRSLNVIDTQDGSILSGGFESFLTRFLDRYQRPIYYQKVSIVAYGVGGKKIWHHRLGGGPHDGITGIFPIGTDIFLAIGTLNSNLGLIELDKDGQILKQREIIREGREIVVGSVAQQSPETFACVIRVRDLQKDELSHEIVVFDQDGTTLKEIRIPQNLDLRVEALGFHKGNTLLMAGYSGRNLADSKARLVRYSDDIGFTDIIHERAHSAFHSIGFLLDNQIVLGGFKKLGRELSKQAVIQGLDGNFTEEFEISYGSFGPDSFHSMVPCWNGGMVLIGEKTISTNSSGSKPRSWVLRTSSQGLSLEKIHELYILGARQAWNKKGLREFRDQHRSSPKFALANYFYQEMNAYDLAKQAKDHQKLLEFAISFPKSPLRNTTLDTLLDKVQSSENTLTMLGFALQFPETVQAGRAFEKMSQWAFEKSSKSKEVDLLKLFVRSYPLSAQFGEAFEQLERLEYINLVNRVNKKQVSLEEAAFRTVEQGSIALQHRDFDEAYRKLSLILESEPFLQTPIASNPMRIEEYNLAKQQYSALRESRSKARNLWVELWEISQEPKTEARREKQRRDLLFWQIKNLLEQFRSLGLSGKYKRQVQLSEINGLGFSLSCEPELQALCLEAKQRLSDFVPVN